MNYHRKLSHLIRAGRPRPSSPKPSKTAIVSFIISVFSVGFGAYQWYASQIESRRNAAIEFTLKSIGDPSIQSDRVTFMRAILRPSTRNEEVFDPKSDEYRENNV